MSRPDTPRPSRNVGDQRSRIPSLTYEAGSHLPWSEPPDRSGEHVLGSLPTREFPCFPSVWPFSPPDSGGGVNSCSHCSLGAPAAQPSRSLFADPEVGSRVTGTARRTLDTEVLDPEPAHEEFEEEFFEFVVVEDLATAWRCVPTARFGPSVATIGHDHSSSNYVDVTSASFNVAACQHPGRGSWTNRGPAIFGRASALRKRRGEGRTVDRSSRSKLGYSSPW